MYFYFFYANYVNLMFVNNSTFYVDINNYDLVCIRAVSYLIICFLDNCYTKTEFMYRINVFRQVYRVFVIS